MKFSISKSLKMLSAAVVSVALISGCKKTFDEPPVSQDPNIAVTHSIAQVRAMHTTGNSEAITQDIVISGIVNADDRSGNYYKQISIQDTSAGITVRLDGTNLYAQYPVGRKVFIKLKGLFLTDYGGLTQIAGNATGGGIASNLFDKYIVKGSYNNAIVPKNVTVATLNNNYQSMLVQLDGAEVVPADTSKTWADAVGQASANINVKQCTGSNIIVRTSGYANFAGVKVPSGNGNLVAIYTVFNSTKQLIIRDTTDARLNGPRCGGGTVPPPPPTGNVLLDENFETQSPNTDVAIAGWNNIATAGTMKWQAKLFSNNKFAQMTAFSSSSPQQNVKSWLITKPVNLNNTSNEFLTFATIDGYKSGTTSLKVYYSTNYSGSGDPTAATWTEFPTYTISTAGTSTGYAASFTPSGNISLNAINGTAVYIAFVYTGGYSTTPASTTTYQIDNIKITAN